MTDQSQGIDVLPPPPYSPRPDGPSGLDRQASHDSLCPPPAYTASTETSAPRSPRDDAPHPTALQPTRSEPSSSRPPPQPPAAQKPSRNFLRSAREAYEERRRIKESQRKVDFYERMYGFVPKNVMTEAEWRDARGRMPKEKVPPRLKKNVFFSGAGFTS